MAQQRQTPRGGTCEAAQLQAHMAALGTFRACRDSLTMSARRGIVLKKSSLADDGNFFRATDAFCAPGREGHIGSHKNDHGPLYPSSRALQRRRRLEINFREIFGVARFSTFATVSGVKTSITSDCVWPLLADIVAKVFLGWRTKILRAANAFCARRREGPYRFIRNRSRASVVELKGDAAAEKSKDPLSREF